MSKYLVVMMMILGGMISNLFGMRGRERYIPEPIDPILSWPNNYIPNTIVDMSDSRVLIGSGKTFATANTAADNTTALQWAVDNYALVTINTESTVVSPFLINGIQIKYNNRSLWLSSGTYIMLADDSNAPFIYTTSGITNFDLRGGTWDINKKNQGVDDLEAADIKEGVVKFAVAVTKAAEAQVTVIQHVVTLTETRANTTWDAAGKVMTNATAKWKTAGGGLVAAGDVIHVSAGTNATAGFYTVASVDSDTQITLTTSIGASPVTVYYEFFRGHGYANSSTVYFADFVGEYAALNGSHVISNSSGCVFTIPVNTSAYTTEFDFTDSRIVTSRANCWRIRTNGRVQYNPAYDYSFESFMFVRVNGLNIQNINLEDSTSEDAGKAGKRICFVGCSDVTVKNFACGLGIYTGGGTVFNVYGPCHNVVLDTISGSMKDDLSSVFDRDWDKQWWYGYGGEPRDIIFKNIVMGTTTAPATNAVHLLSRSYPLRNITIDNVSGYVTTNVIHARGDNTLNEVSIAGTKLWDPSRTMMNTQIENLRVNNVFCYAGARTGGADSGAGNALFSINNEIGGSCYIKNVKNLHSGTGTVVWTNDRACHWDTVVIESAALADTSVGNLVSLNAGYAADLSTYHNVTVDGFNHTFPSTTGRTVGISVGCTVDVLNLKNIRQVMGSQMFFGVRPTALNITNLRYSHSGQYNAPIYIHYAGTCALTYSGWVFESGNVDTLLANCDAAGTTLNVTGSGYSNLSTASMRWYIENAAVINLLYPFDSPETGSTSHTHAP